MQANAKQKVKYVDLELTVIRADGREEHLGVVSSSRWLWNHGLGRWLAARRTRKANERA